ncbi:helix-turn-helix transcriptional regulator [Georgenia sp. Z1344]|uniref:helix-turn-helix transcriptional regulator n=1 Tax=Georgenia sp. Z1344 TaxID=3416706 RepID=UPI003CFB7030
MENTSGSGTQNRRAHSPSRAQVLELVRRNRGVRLSAIARFTGLHENTVRGHLEALLDEGLVERSRGTATGRGRPPWVWRPTRPDDAGYAGLASALARSLTGLPDAGSIAHEAGRAWAADLEPADDATNADDETRSSPTAIVVDLMRRLGYEPQHEAGTPRVTLHSCPLLEAAAETPEVVCAVHHGLVRGALEARGAGDVPTSLEPFASPGTCVLRVGGSDE